jgi:hypothetical protein
MKRSLDTLTRPADSILDLVDANGPVPTAVSPEAFGLVGGAAAEGITFDENALGGFLALSVPRGETLGVAAGEINLQSSGGSLFLQAPGGSVGLAAMGAAAGEVAIASLDISTMEPDQLGPSVRRQNILDKNGSSLRDSFGF